MMAELPFTDFWQLSGPTAWVVLWSVLAGLTIALVVLLRTKWRHAKAWRKCAVLSLWVHFLLACLATTVRIVSGSPGLGDDPPMRIRIVAELSEEDDLVDQTPQSPPAKELEETPTKPPPEAPVELQPIDEQPAPPVDVVPQADEEAPAPTRDDPPSQAAASEPVESPTKVEAPDLLDQPPTPTETAPHDPLDAASSQQAPSERLLAEVDSPPPTDAVEAPVAELPSDDSGQAVTLPPQLSVRSGAPSADAEPNESEPASPTQPTSPPLPAAYADRFSENREQLLASRGGNARTERAVKSALAWLAAAQSDDGRWNAARHGAGRERVVLGQNRSGAGAQADAGVTGLALLAFMGAGYTHQHGAYADAVGDGLAYLESIQAPNGALYGQAQMFAQMYCHSMATFAASEAYAITRDEQLAKMVRMAAAYSLAMQHPTDGGWRYFAGQPGDTSQLGWQLMAIKSAELAGSHVPQSTWAGVDHFLHRVQRGVHGGLAVYRPEEARPSPTMTAEALFCRLLMNDRRLAEVDRASIDEAVGMLLRQPPNQREVNLYYWYYATLALHRLRDASPQWSAAWRQWNEALQRSLLTTQRDDGSWPESTVWGGYGGRVYTTALAAMCLEAYYRYSGPIQQANPSVARGQGGLPAR